MNKSTLYEWAGFFFSKARYMIGVGFKILTRTPVPKLSPPPPGKYIILTSCNQLYQLIGLITRYVAYRGLDLRIFNVCSCYNKKKM